eukprot:10749949-Alexandrium_andersonii.AAC.1
MPGPAGTRAWGSTVRATGSGRTPTRRWAWSPSSRGASCGRARPEPSFSASAPESLRPWIGPRSRLSPS